MPRRQIVRRRPAVRRPRVVRAPRGPRVNRAQIEAEVESLRRQHEDLINTINKNKKVLGPLGVVASVALANKAPTPQQKQVVAGVVKAAQQAPPNSPLKVATKVAVQKTPLAVKVGRKAWSRAAALGQAIHNQGPVGYAVAGGAIAGAGMVAGVPVAAMAAPVVGPVLAGAALGGVGLAAYHAALEVPKKGVDLFFDLAYGIGNYWKDFSLLKLKLNAKQAAAAPPPAPLPVYTNIFRA